MWIVSYTTYTLCIHSPDVSHRRQHVDTGLLGCVQEPDYSVVAPFPGIIYLSDRPDEVIIESRGGSPKDVLFFITNIKANDTVKERSNVELEVGRFWLLLFVMVVVEVILGVV